MYEHVGRTTEIAGHKQCTNSAAIFFQKYDNTAKFGGKKKRILLRWPSWALTGRNARAILDRVLVKNLFFQAELTAWK
jgi:hypothetical protein